MPEAKLDRESCNAKPMTKPATPKPASTGPREMPTWDRPINIPMTNTILRLMDTIILRNNWDRRSCERSRPASTSLWVIFESLLNTKKMRAKISTLIELRSRFIGEGLGRARVQRGGVLLL